MHIAARTTVFILLNALGVYLKKPLSEGGVYKREALVRDGRLIKIF